MEEFLQVYGNIDVDAIVKIFDTSISKDGFFYENDRFKSLVKAI